MFDPVRLFTPSTPEAAGIPSAAIENYIRDLAEEHEFALHSLLVVKAGRLVYEGYWKPFDASFKHRLYSCSKSFVSVAVGVLCAQGILHLDDQAVSFFPEFASLVQPNLAKATIRDLLLMSAPYSGSNYHPTAPCWSETFFTQKANHLPGQVYSYCTGGTTMLCAIIKRVTGKDFLDVLRPALDEIGFSKDAACVRTPDGYQWGGSGVLATTQDFGRFALLCSRMGNWNGKQLLPEDYMKEATSPLISNWLDATSPDEGMGYGYQFWSTRHGGFSFRGMGGQFGICLPDKDLVIITTSYDELNFHGMQSPFSALWRHIYPALSDSPLPENPEALASLKQLTDSLTFRCVSGDASSPVAEKVSGITYTMDENAMGLKWIRFDFEGNTGVFTYENRRGVFSLPFGQGCQVDSVFPEIYWAEKIDEKMDHPYRALTSAAWFREETLLVQCQIVDIYLGNLRMDVRFHDSHITLQMRKHAEWFLEDYQGFASGYAEKTK